MEDTDRGLHSAVDGQGLSEVKRSDNGDQRNKSWRDIGVGGGLHPAVDGQHLS